MAHSFWDPSEGRYGLFDPWSFKRLEALVASGLGGGSLIYANVLIRKDPAWFREEDRDWPVSAAALEEHYDEAERMLGATPYPFDREPYSRTPKTRELKGAAERLGLDWTLPKLAVSFTPAGSALGVPIDEPEGNLHAAPRFTCRLCGECDIGCNLGSKNTLDFNYLSAAKREGADIRVLSQVRTFEPRRGNGAGWKVRYDQHDPEARKSRRRTLTAKRLILSAGTFGSTYLMHRQAHVEARVQQAERRAERRVVRLRPHRWSRKLVRNKDEGIDMTASLPSTRQAEACCGSANCPRRTSAGRRSPTTSSSPATTPARPTPSTRRSARRSGRRRRPAGINSFPAIDGETLLVGAGTPGFKKNPKLELTA